MNQRIVVTGYGVITPVGLTVSDFWTNVRGGKSGVSDITVFENADLPIHYAAQIGDFDPNDYMDKKDARKIDRIAHFSIAASREAIASSSLDIGAIDPFRMGCIFGVGIGGMYSFENGVGIFNAQGWKRMPIMTVPKIMPNAASSSTALIIGDIRGPNYSVNTACSSGTDAITLAANHLRAGDADVILAGGAEACLTRFGIAGFCVLHALSTKYADNPTASSRPFDKDRDGFVMGEGAAVLVLETLEHAKKRGAIILGEFAGGAITCDAYHYTAPHPDVIASKKAMQLAIERAGISPNNIDYINAHGTSTPVNDSLETKAIKSVFGEHAYNVKISSTKSMTGHCIGATGVIEAIVCIKSIQDQFIPPTINLDNPDPECDLHYTPHNGISAEVNYAMSNTLGFGGHNGVVIFKKYKE